MINQQHMNVGESMNFITNHIHKYFQALLSGMQNIVIVLHNSKTFFYRREREKISKVG